DFEFTFFDRVEIDQLLELFDVGRFGIKCFALVSANDRAFESPALLHACTDVGFDLFGDFGRSGGAIAGGEFQALVFGGIVAGGHVDAADGFARADGVRDDGRGRVAFAEQGSEVVEIENFGGGE